MADLEWKPEFELLKTDLCCPQCGAELIGSMSLAVPASKADKGTAKAFILKFQVLWSKAHHGATYKPVWGKHSSMVARLLALYGPEDLEKMAHVLQATNDDWIAKTERGLEQLDSKASWLHAKVKAWEGQHGAVLPLEG